MFGRLGVDGLSEDGVTKTKVIDRIRKCKSPTAIFFRANCICKTLKNNFLMDYNHFGRNL